MVVDELGNDVLMERLIEHAGTGEVRPMTPREVREMVGVSQSRLAELAGVSLSTVQKLERPGAPPISKASLAKIDAALAAVEEAQKEEHPYRRITPIGYPEMTQVPVTLLADLVAEKEALRAEIEDLRAQLAEHAGRPRPGER
jgi:transcriptional regulator with XRE-family HTH domain